MIEIARFLYFVERADLRPVERLLAAYASHLFWVGGERQPVAALRPTTLHEHGIGAGTAHAGGAIRGLEAAGILERIDPLHFRLLDEPARWRCWEPGSYEQVSAEWLQILEPTPPLQTAVLDLLRAIQIPAGPHRTDPVFSRWLCAAVAEARRYGEERVREALSEAARDPGAVFPRRPDRLRELMYPFLQRARRRRVS